MMKKNIFLIMISLIEIFIISSCKDKSVEISEGTRTVRPVVPPITAVTTITVSEKKKYVYGGLSFRDPFLPSSGERLARAKLGLTKEAIIPSLGSLNLKGIIEDSKDKIALFTSPYGSYMFVNGKLYDSQNRLVRGVSGKLISKGDNEKKQVGVILITEDNYYKEFFLKEKVQ